MLDMSNHRSLQTSTTISLEHIQPAKRSNRSSRLNPIISCDSARLSHLICSIQVTFNHLQRTSSYLGYPPSELCPICFAEGFKTVFVCFDGNFQLTMLGTRLEKWEGISPQDLKDKRIFDEKEPTIQAWQRAKPSRAWGLLGSSLPS